MPDGWKPPAFNAKNRFNKNELAFRERSPIRDNNNDVDIINDNNNNANRNRFYVDEEKRQLIIENNDLKKEKRELVLENEKLRKDKEDFRKRALNAEGEVEAVRADKEELLHSFDLAKRSNRTKDNAFANKNKEIEKLYAGIDAWNRCVGDQMMLKLDAAPCYDGKEAVFRRETTADLYDPDRPNTLVASKLTPAKFNGILAKDFKPCSIDAKAFEGDDSRIRLRDPEKQKEADELANKVMNLLKNNSNESASKPGVVESLSKNQKKSSKIVDRQLLVEKYDDVVNPLPEYFHYRDKVFMMLEFPDGIVLYNVDVLEYFKDSASKYLAERWPLVRDQVEWLTGLGAVVSFMNTIGAYKPEEMLLEKFQHCMDERPELQGRDYLEAEDLVEAEGAAVFRECSEAAKVKRGAEKKVVSFETDK